MIKNREDNEVVNDEYESKENGFNNFIDNVTTNHYIGINNNDVKLRWRNLGSWINHLNNFLLYK